MSLEKALAENTRAVLALTELLSGIANSGANPVSSVGIETVEENIPDVKPVAKKPAAVAPDITPVEVQKEISQPEAPTIGYQLLAQAVTELSTYVDKDHKRVGRERTLAIFAKYKIRLATEAKPEQYAALLSDINAALAALKSA